MIKTYRQGELDGLCGIYSVVHAFKCIVPTEIKGLEGIDSHLFQELMKAVPRALLPDFFWGGISTQDLVKTARKFSSDFAKKSGIPLQVSQPFRRKRFKSRDHFLETIKAMSMGEHCSFIIWIDWPASSGAHWSVFRGAGSENLRLFDSGGQHKISLKTLRLGGSRGTRLQPGDTIMLKIGEK